MKPRIMAITMVLIMTALSLVGCKSQNDSGTYSLEVKFYSDSGDGHGNTMKISGDYDGNKSKFNIYKRGMADTGYSIITDGCLYGSDLYIGLPQLLGEISKVSSVSGYLGLIDYTQDYLLINDDYMDKAFKLYQRNLALPETHKNKIVTEAEIAGKEDNIQKAYDNILKEKEEQRKKEEKAADSKDYVGFERYLPKFSVMATHALEDIINSVKNSGATHSFKTGVNILELDSDKVVNLLTSIKDSANSKDYIWSVYNSGGSDFLDTLVRSNSDSINSMVGEYADKMLKSATESGKAVVKVSNSKGNKQVYIRITTNGSNGIEILFKNKTGVKNKNKDGDTDINVPKNCLTVEDAYNKSMEKFINEK